MPDINPAEILIHIINILVLYFILRGLLYKPVRQFMKERSERIAASLAEAESKRSEADQLHSQYDEKLRLAEADADLKSAEILKKANEDASGIVSGAQDEAHKIVSDAHVKADADAKARLDGLRDEIGDIAVGIAGRILSREVNRDDNKKIADEFFDKKA